MNYTDIQARLAIIKSLPISELDKRQPLLVALAADIVNGETSDGNDTDGLIMCIFKVGTDCWPL